MSRKWFLIGLGVLAGLIAIGIGGFWYMSTQPLYKPGMVREEVNLSAPLAPPAQPQGAAAWLVEPGIDLAHFAMGEGRNVLVVHGGPGMPFLEPVSGLEPLTDEFRFHYYDQRGSGASTRPIDQFATGNRWENMQILDRTLGLGAQIADIERIRQILGEEKLLLIGHSWGGFLASLYAAEFPEHTEALVLVSPANVLVMPQPEAESDLFTSVRANLPAEQQADFDTFMADYFDFNSLFEKSEADLVDMNIQFGEYYINVINAATKPVQGRPGGWMVWAQYLSMGQRHDYRSSLAAVDAPVLVLHGAADLQSEAASRMYAETFPNAEFVVIENAGHFSFEEAPEFTEAVADFLDRVRD